MKRSQILLLLIIILALFFRTYQMVERMGFGHDADLFSWIVKDILVNGHPRLIGQLTSAPGIYIGPLFYYLLAPFFLLTKMDPVGANLPAILLGLLTTISYYFVFSKIFNEKVGLLGALLYGVLPATVNFDRWIVPTITTSLWSIWYFYAVIMISRGKFYFFWLMGVLIGLIWHIHIALIPVLVTFPFAILVSKKLPGLKNTVLFLALLFATSLPLIIFEFKHNFSQTFSLINNFGLQQEGGPTGLYRFQLILSMLTGSSLLTATFLLAGLLLVKKKIMALKEMALLYIWIAAAVLFFYFSSSPISEYYFSNTRVVFLAIASLLIFALYKFFKKGLVILIILSLILINSFSSLINQNYYAKGYQEKKAVVNYIIADAKDKNFPCFSINYITAPGENVGFRYFFFLKNAHIAVPGRGSPVYNIVIPDEYALNEVKVKFGHIGIIPPRETPAKDLMLDACSGQNTNLTDPMFGYVQ
ncbi:glycosyltransferase family 39 protein [Candidatus Daviesbacteria bacterium]|nr:glycosyltransferase family 39 protein [Candidatus Daviesbacteria bacterium]